jgi:hypothetical protein
MLTGAIGKTTWHEFYRAQAVNVMNVYVSFLNIFSAHDCVFAYKQCVYVVLRKVFFLPPAAIYQHTAGV